MPKPVSDESLDSIDGRFTDAGYARSLIKRAEVKALASRLNRQSRQRYRDVTRMVMESPTKIGDSTHNADYISRRKGKGMPAPIQATVVKRQIVGRGRKAIFSNDPAWIIGEVGGMLDCTEDIGGKLKNGVKLESLLTHERSKDSEKEWQRLSSAVKRVVRASTADDHATFSVTLATREDGSTAIVCVRGEDSEPENPATETPAETPGDDSGETGQDENGELVQMEGETDEAFLARLETHENETENENQ